MSCPHQPYCTSNLCPVRDEYPYDCSRLRGLLDNLVVLRDEFDIRPSPAAGVTDRKRIAILVADLWLTMDFQAHSRTESQIEGEVYQAATGLACIQIPQEHTAASNPLAITHLHDEVTPGRLTKLIVACLSHQPNKEEHEHGKPQDRTASHGRISLRTPRMHKKQPGRVSAKRTPARRPRAKGVLP